MVTQRLTSVRPVIPVSHFLCQLGESDQGLRSGLDETWLTVIESPRLRLYAIPRVKGDFHKISNGAFALIAGHWRETKFPMPTEMFFDHDADEEELGEIEAGSFAACVVEHDQSHVVLRRDAAGSQRIYFTEKGNTTVFSDNLDVLISALPRKPAIDHIPLVMFCEHLLIPAPHTPWIGVRQFFPGEHRRYSVRSPKPVYTGIQIRSNPRLRSGSSLGDGLHGEEAISALDSALRAEMSSVLNNEPSPGILLSGGKDSSSLLIACPEEKRKDLVCIIGASKESELDESNLASRLARDLGHPVIIGHHNARILDDILREKLGSFEMPNGDPTVLSLLSIQRAIKNRISLLIDGTGNDSLFGIPVTARDRQLAALRSVPGIAQVAQFLSASALADWKPGLRRLARPRNRLFLSWDGVVPRQASSRHLTAFAWIESLSIVNREELIIEVTQTTQALWEPSGPCYRSNQLAEACNIPIAYPWLGPLLTKTMLKLSRNEILKGTQNKWALRRWLNTNAPPYIASKPKGKFIVPLRGLLKRWQSTLEEWHMNPSKTRLYAAGIPLPLLKDVLKAWLGGRRSMEKSIYAFIVLEVWLERHLE